MLFNSISFAIFFPIVFVFYWFFTQKSLRLQNFLLLVSSYFFYSCWDWRFLFLLMFSTLLDYFTGLQMCRSDKQSLKRFWFWLSVLVNLGFLGIFKYYNFFVESFTEAMSLVGFTVHPATIKVILPVGISFYTFHGLSYVIDIYKGRIKAERNFVDYAVFVSFFPLLVAGPIERATHLLPQIKQKRIFEYERAADGMRQILWGLFKKIVIADNCAKIVDKIFDNYETMSSPILILGAVLFAFQIYCDFSGYSDIALGTARLLGIELLRNFAFPYFARDIAEFWRRWHISLTTWFRDYLYIPLGGSRGGVWMKIRNTFVIFLVSGFWHGANWTFIIWGALNATYFLPLLLTSKNRNHLEIVAKGKLFPSLVDIFNMLVTFVLVVFGWIFFRSKSVSNALVYIKGIFSMSFKLFNFNLDLLRVVATLITIVFMLICEWLQREHQHGMSHMPQNKILRWSIYLIIVLLIFSLGTSQQDFIYFQF